MDFKGLCRVKPGLIDKDPDQPRRIFDRGAIEELARSIAEVGILQPLLVFRHKDRFRLLAGERRLVAAMMVGLDEVPAVIVEPDPVLNSVLAMVENTHRKDLSSLEQAGAIAGIMKKTGWTQAETGRKIGLSQPSIANKMRLLDLDESVREMVLAGNIGERHARALIGLSPGSQRELAERVFHEGLSARIVEKMARSHKEGTRVRGDKIVTSSLGNAILGDISQTVQRRKQEGLNVTMKVRSTGESGKKLEILVTVLLNEAGS
ncbi:MAG: ParB/RepB/Spo0J family partition protein [Thermovirgaceae bacterium]|nr:ParB/RepB/Spo0J family partition protein [Thermovirgaceae bacterium]